jgi:hypothetical protein
MMTASSSSYKLSHFFAVYSCFGTHIVMYKNIGIDNTVAFTVQSGYDSILIRWIGCYRTTSTNFKLQTTLVED